MMTEKEIKKLIRIEILHTFITLTEYVGRMKEGENMHDVLRKLKWKLTSQLEDMG